MTALAVIVIGISLLILIMLFGALKAINEVKDLLENIIKTITNTENNLELELKNIRIENTRLRRRLNEANDDEDIFPARQHTIVSFKRGDDGPDMMRMVDGGDDDLL